MHTTPPYQNEEKSQYDSTAQVFKTPQASVTPSPFRKNNRAPWDVSALEGIKITSSLSALRAKAKEQLALSK